MAEYRRGKNYTKIEPRKSAEGSLEYSAEILQHTNVTMRNKLPQKIRGNSACHSGSGRVPVPTNQIGKKDRLFTEEQRYR